MGGQENRFCQQIRGTHDKPAGQAHSGPRDAHQSPDPREKRGLATAVLRSARPTWAVLPKWSPWTLHSPLTMRCLYQGGSMGPEVGWPHVCLGQESMSVSLLTSKARPRASQTPLALGTSITPRPPVCRPHGERSPGCEG